MEEIKDIELEEKVKLIEEKHNVDLLSIMVSGDCYEPNCGFTDCQSSCGQCTSPSE